MNGLINVRKEAGWTSQDVCAKLRGILHTKKTGHTGTLDPDAEGVLVVCAGTATRLVSLLTDHDKEYIALCKLGVTTDTGDLSGQVLTTSDVTCDEGTLKECVQRFKGEIEQVPPMYSALKVDGKRLYELAREGKEVERKPRRVRIDAISVLDTSRLASDGLFTMEVRCSRGTYIRTLCEDIGEALQCGGTMAHLLRTAVGAFRIEDAKTIGEIEAYAKEGRLDEIVVPVEKIFRDFDKMCVKSSSDAKLRNGNPLTAEDFEDLSPRAEEADVPGPRDDAVDALESVFPQDDTEEDTGFTDGTRVRVYDSTGDFYAIYRYDERKKKFMTDLFLHG